MPKWWEIVLGILLVAFVGIPTAMVFVIYVCKWTVFVLERVFG